MDYDVVVVGSGVVGASIARLLSSYELKAAVIEKFPDACFGVSKANSGIIHGAFHHATTTLKARLELKGNMMYDQLHKELGFPFKRTGIIVAAFSSEEMKTVRLLYKQGVANGAPGIEICGSERLLNLEPGLNPDIAGGLYAPFAGVVEPYRFVFSLMESAQLNGLDFIRDFEVVRSSYDGKLHQVFSSDGRAVAASFVINAAGLYADKISEIFNGEKFKIHPRKGEEFLLDRNSPARPNNVIFPVPAKESKGMLVIPTVEGTTMIGPTSEKIDDKEDSSTTYSNMERIFLQASRMVSGISRRDVITSFSGLRPVLENEDFLIEKSQMAPAFIQVAGIQSPGLTAAPAIAEYVLEILSKDCGLKLEKKKSFIPEISRTEKIYGISPEKLDELIEKNPAYGNIVCRCEQISEAEIVDAIRKGHTTIDGIKFYTRSGMGRCQGGFCTYKILKIISRETGIPIDHITRRGNGSFITGERISGELK
ncbi:MAG: FAD/NAD(P)-binding oxidoreductase [Lentisphaerae bacterium GWF2_45_14]|nr:MAG: FAD/NAD(P)-binding oxidoreductase [Lentisphaerae bacterium GWF2_45_14]